jgi:hypothetical protein
MRNKNSSEGVSHGQRLRERRSFSTSQDYLLRAQQHLALGVSSGFRSKAQPLPLYVDGGEGAWFRDVDGNRFLDHCLAWGPLILGHAHPAINEAVRDQLNRGYTYGAQCKLEFLVAEKICELVPCAQRVLFVNTGTEAVQCALRVARAGTGRAKIVKFEGHYHGWADNVLVSYQPPLEQAGPPQVPEAVPAGHGQVLSAYSDTVVLPWNDESLLERYLEEHGSEVAASTGWDLFRSARFVKGLSTSVAAALLSSLFNIALAYGVEFNQLAMKQGAKPFNAANAQWAYTVTFGYLPNLAVSLFRLSREQLWGSFAKAGSMCTGCGPP